MEGSWMLVHGNMMGNEIVGFFWCRVMENYVLSSLQLMNSSSSSNNNVVFNL
jgi:hypothetical protein